MKSGLNVKLGQVAVSSNSAQNDSSSLQEIIYLITICPNSHDKLTKCDDLLCQVGVHSNIAQIHSSGL